MLYVLVSFCMSLHPAHMPLDFLWLCLAKYMQLMNERHVFLMFSFYMFFCDHTGIIANVFVCKL